MTLVATPLFASGELDVHDVRCSCPPRRVDEEMVDAWEVVLPTSGLFRRRSSASAAAVVDASSGYVVAPGDVQEIEHVTEGDRCIAVVLDERLADELGVTAAPAIQRTAAHHRLVASARRAVDEEAWLGAIASLFPRAAATRVVTAPHRRAVDDVRAAIAADPGGPWDLRALGRIAGYAPHHLSRLFRRATGTTLTEHRDHVRLARATELVADGMAIADVAAELGFADHAHLTRRAKAVLGLTPSQLRR